METAEDGGGKGSRTEHSDGADGARSEHSALARCKYNILALEATGGGHARAGAAVGEDSHDASEEREGPRTVEEGDKTPQRALPAQETGGG